MKTHCLQTNETQHCLGKESALGAIAGGESIVLIKSLISQDALGAQGCQVQLKSSADNLHWIKRIQSLTNHQIHKSGSARNPNESATQF